jgi:hypothetical protein
MLYLLAVVLIKVLLVPIFSCTVLYSEARFSLEEESQAQKVRQPSISKEGTVSFRVLVIEVFGVCTLVHEYITVLRVVLLSSCFSHVNFLPP